MALTDLTRISTSGIATGTSLSGAILHGDAHFRGTQIGVTSALFDSSQNELNFKDNVQLTFGNATNGDLRLYHDGIHSHIFDNGSGDLRVTTNGSKIDFQKVGGEILARFITDGSVDLYYNNSRKFQTTQSGSIVTGILTATGFSGPLSNPSGISTFYDLRVTNNLTVEGSTTTLDTNLIGVDRVEVGANSNSIVGVAVTQSGTADLVNLFDGATKVVTVDDVGNVGLGSAIPSAKLDVNGTSKFQDDVIVQKELSFADSPYVGSTIPPNSLRFGDNDDLILYHTGNYSGIDERGGGTGGLVFHCTNNFTVKGNASNKLRIIAKEGGAVELYHDNSKRLETTASGINVTAPAPAIFFNDTTHSVKYTVSGDANVLKISDTSNGDRLQFNSNGTTSLYGFLSVSGSVYGQDGLSTNGNIDINDDNDKLRIGASDDLQLYHDGTNSRIHNTNTGNLIIRNEVQDADVYIQGNDGGSNVSLLTFDTSETGMATLYGELNMRGTHRIKFNYNTGNGNFESFIGQRFTSNSFNFVINNQQNNIFVESDNVVFRGKSGQGDETLAQFQKGGASSLHYGGSAKLSTAGHGINITGGFVATADCSIADKLTHAGDENTAIRFPTNDQISFETNGSEQMKIAGTNITLGTNATTGHILQIKNRNADSKNTNALGLDIQAAWIRIGDALSGGQTYSNGLGIKLHDSGVVHWSVGTIGSGFYISNTSNSGTELFPDTRTDALAFDANGSAVFSGNVTVGNNLYVPDKIYHVGDTDTLIEFATDTITFDTAGSERLRIGSTGFLTLTNGNAANWNTIQRYATTLYCGVRIQDADATQRMQFGVAGGTNQIATGAAQHDVVLKSYANLLLATNQTERLRIDNQGSVIINGTTSFGGGNTKLQVRGASSAISDGAQIFDIASTAASNGGTRLAFGVNEDNYTWIRSYESAVGARDLVFAVSSERLRITTDGNLIAGRTDGAFTYNDTSASNNTFLELYGGTTAGNRGILSLSGRTGSNDGLLGTIWFVNGNNAGTGPANNMKLAAAIQARAVTNNNNSQGDSGGHIQFYTKAQGGSLNEKVRINETGGIKFHNQASGNFIQYSNSTVAPNAAINLLRYGNGYCDMRLASNYGAKVMLAGASDNTDEFTIQQSNLKEAYVNNEATGKHINLQVGGVTKLQIGDDEESVRVAGTSADHSGTTGGSKGFTLQNGGGYSVPMYFGNETDSAQKSMYLNGYWIYLRGHQNEGVRFVFSQSAGNAIRSDKYQFKYNSATRPGSSTTWDGFSDERAKENVQTITNGIETIKKLRPVTFDWTNDYADAMGMWTMDKSDPREYKWFAKKENGYDTDVKNGRYGFIAQEYETVLPKDVKQDKFTLGDTEINDFRTINHDSLIPSLTAALKEAIAKIEVLEAKVAALEGS